MPPFGRPTHLEQVGETRLPNKKVRDKVIARQSPYGILYELNGTMVANDEWQPDPNTMDITWAPSYEELAAKVANPPNPFLGDIGEQARPNANQVMDYINAPQRR